MICRAQSSFYVASAEIVMRLKKILCGLQPHKI